MSTTVTLSASKSARIDKYNPDTNFSSNTTESSVTYYTPLLFGFANPASSLMYKQISDVAMKIEVPIIWVDSSSSVGMPCELYPLKSAWTENTVTYNNAPDRDWANDLYEYALRSLSVVKFNENTYLHPDAIEKILKYGLMVYWRSSESWADFRTTRSSPVPTIEATFLDTDAYIYADTISPSSGFVPKNEASVFSWTTAKNGYCIGDITIASASIQWKESASGTVNTISCGAVNSYTVPANTFTSDAVYWRVEITDSTGHVSDSSWVQLSTVDVTSDASIVSPKSSVIDGSVANVFSWEHIISTSTQPTGANLQKSDDNSTWTTLATVTGSATSVSIPASTFSSGQHYWRVQTLNSSGTAGNWSSSASFVSISAPNTPSVSVTQEPRPTVSWQASDQQGYEVKIGSTYDSGTKFGTATAFQIPMYLDDGSYTVSVRVKNAYGIWSSWGTAPLTVSNTAGTAITLTYGGNGLLTWTGTGYDKYAVYRDDELIYVTTEKSYTERSRAGYHSYVIRGMYTANTNYGLSNKITVNIAVEYLTINDLEDDVTLVLKYNTSSVTDVSISDSISDVLTHITGSAYPMVETSSFKEKAMKFSVAFLSQSDEDTFVAMFGHKVSVLSPKGSSVVGILDATSRKETTFNISYNCTIQQIAEDEITL